MTVMNILKDIVDAARPIRSPVDSFDEVLRAREKRYGELRRSTLRVLYMKNKLEAELVERRAEVARVYHAARTAARAGNDELCLALLAEKRELEIRLKIASDGVAEAKANAETAHRALDAFKGEMRELERERWERASALDTIALTRHFESGRSSERALREEEKLDAARLHIDRVTAERDIDRRIAAESLSSHPELMDDTDLRIELARLKARSAKYRSVRSNEG